MFKLLRQLLQLQTFTGISLPELLRFAQALITIGMPPAVAEEKDLRQWLGKVVDVFSDLAAETPTNIDDTGVAMIGGMIANDDVWSVVYSAMVLILSRNAVLAPADEAELADNLARVMGPAASSGRDMAAIDPLVIIMIIRTIVELIRQWRRID